MFPVPCVKWQEKHCAYPSDFSINYQDQVGLYGWACRINPWKTEWTLLFRLSNKGMAHKFFIWHRIFHQLNRKSNKRPKKKEEEPDKVKPDHVKDYFELKIREAGALLTRGDHLWDSQRLTRLSRFRTASPTPGTLGVKRGWGGHMRWPRIEAEVGIYILLTYKPSPKESRYTHEVLILASGNAL